MEKTGMNREIMPKASVKSEPQMTAEEFKAELEREAAAWGFKTLNDYLDMLEEVCVTQIGERPQ